MDKPTKANTLELFNKMTIDEQTALINKHVASYERYKDLAQVEEPEDGLAGAVMTTVATLAVQLRGKIKHEAGWIKVVRPRTFEELADIAVTHEYWERQTEYKKEQDAKAVEQV